MSLSSVVFFLQFTMNGHPLQAQFDLLVQTKLLPQYGTVAKQLVVKPSLLNDAGNGLFTNCLIKKNELATFMEGRLIARDEAMETIISKRDSSYYRTVIRSHVPLTLCASSTKFCGISSNAFCQCALHILLHFATLSSAFDHPKPEGA